MFGSKPNEAITRRALMACVVSAAVACDAVAQARKPPAYLYVAEVHGTWVAQTGSNSVALQPLVRVSSAARFRPTGDQSQAVLVLRDPASLTRFQRRCAEKSCQTPLSFADFDIVRTALATKVTVDQLYADLGERAEIRERIRLVGARGNDRDLGIVVLTRSAARVDLSEIAQKLDQPRDRLVARFCNLSAASAESDDCIEARTRMPGDCDLASQFCEVSGTGSAAYRVDVYVRERAMLGSVAVASGFAAIVPAADRERALTTRDALAKQLKQAAPALVDDEIRGLSAAATFAVAGLKR